MSADVLTYFLHWWADSKPIFVPSEHIIINDGQITGLVLYREDQFQVQLFIVQPNSVIKNHVHPDVDSYEVYLGGDIDFFADDTWYKQTDMQEQRFLRIKPDCVHGGKFGERGGSFLSVQHWLNGVKPTSVGENWHDDYGREHGSADSSTAIDAEN